MFTGLIEEIGTVEQMRRAAKSGVLAIQANRVLSGIRVGDSISVNGVCLTVIQFSRSAFSVDVMPETMRRSNLNSLQRGSRVNLERALKLGDRLGGHIVSGHIDGIGRVSALEEEDNATWVTIQAPPAIMKYIVEKGSIAVDGTSLTVAAAGEQSFRVSIIPLTQAATTLLSRRPGDEVNLECDMVAKYIERFMMFRSLEKETPKALDLDFLKDNGFV